jgi:hypothetical protein
MKFRKKRKFWYGIPAYTGPFRALGLTIKCEGIKDVTETHIFRVWKSVAAVIMHKAEW